jgi:thiamine biosynthesis lipoprotein
MNMRITIALLSVVALVIIITKRRDERPEYLRISGAAQGTTYKVVWKSPDGRILKPEIEAVLRELDHSLSTYAADSIITGINGNNPDVTPDRHVLEVMTHAIRVHRDTGGAFDPTIAPVVRASGFGPDAAVEINAQAIREAMRFVGLDKISIVDGRVIKERPEITLDLNGIAQGYSVDVVSELLEARGIRNFMVEIGGEVRARGVNADRRDWRVGIDRPSEGNVFPGSELQAILTLRDRALATSGNYRAFHEVGGRKYTHCIDPRTGASTASTLLSVTVTAPTCTLADACATACMVMGLEESVTFIESRDDLEALFIHADASGTLQTRATKGLTVDE